MKSKLIIIKIEAMMYGFFGRISTNIEEIAREVPSENIKKGISLFKGIFILYRFNIKKDPPQTAIDENNAKKKRFGNKLNELNVNHETLNIKIQEEIISITLLIGLINFEVKKLNPMIRKAIFSEKIGFKIILYNRK